MKALLILLLCLMITGCTAQQMRNMQAFCAGMAGTYRQPTYCRPVYYDNGSDAIVSQMRIQESNRQFERLINM